jgi:hypothetical protein
VKEFITKVDELIDKEEDEEDARYDVPKAWWRIFG